MNHWKYSLSCVGIKKRGRKLDRHFFSNIGQSSNFDENIGRDLASTYLAQNMKTFSKAELHASFHQDLGNGCERWEPFNEAHNKRVTL